MKAEDQSDGQNYRQGSRPEGSSIRVRRRVQRSPTARRMGRFVTRLGGRRVYRRSAR